MVTVDEVGVQSLARLVRDTRPLEAPAAVFQNESERMLGIDVKGGVWVKPGAAVAYRGAIRFARRATLEAASPTDAVLREAAPLVRASGTGRLYCGHHGSHVRVVRLAGDGIVVAWPDLLAFEEALDFQPALVGHGVGLASGGLVAVTLSGHGSVAFVTHGEPLTLMVTPGHPVSTDPHATLAWSPSLAPALKFDVSWRSAIGHGGQEPVQMFFEGDGFVVVQPFKDPSRFGVSVNPLKQLTALVTK